MSNIGKQIDNRSFNPIITNIDYSTLLGYANANKSINVPNSFIISVPQEENGGDKVDAASIWMTDENGYLLNITKPNKTPQNTFALAPEETIT